MILVSFLEDGFYVDIMFKYIDCILFFSITWHIGYALHIRY